MSPVAQRLDVIAFPGMIANFDAAKSAALAISLLDWREHGAGYAASMVETAHALDNPVHDGLSGLARQRRAPARRAATRVTFTSDRTSVRTTDRPPVMSPSDGARSRPLGMPSNLQV
jgi:hypothetical protein